MKKDDIFILASDGLSDNLWDEVLDEVVRTLRGLLVDSQEVDDLETDNALKTTTEVEGKAALEPETGPTAGVKRKTLVGILSEALCLSTRRV